jgi:tetratricopeptide (TPR) repeat protein
VRYSALVLVLVLLLGCSSEEPEKRPESPEQKRSRLEKRLVDTGDKDPWAYLELGELDESEGDLEKAVQDYGASVALLPAQKYTRPAVSLGRVHLKRMKWEPARRMFEEVLRTVPSESKLYKENPDYREAALGLKEVFAHLPDERAAERTRQRFLDELGGAEKDWPAK